MMEAVLLHQENNDRAVEMRGKQLSMLGLALILMEISVSGCGLGSATTRDMKPYLNNVHGYGFAYAQDCLYEPIPLDWKQKPPEERRQESLCFLNGENPDDVTGQTFLGDKVSLSLAMVCGSHYDTPAYHPPEDVELADWVKVGFSESSVEFPDEPNMEIDGVPVVKLSSPSSPLPPSYEEGNFFQNDVLLRISMVGVDNEYNKALNDPLISTFTLVI